MSESRFSLRQVVAIAAGAVALVGVAALAGGAVGYQLGKADGQAQADQRLSIPSLSELGGLLGGFDLPRVLPFEGDVPREFGIAQAYLGVRFEPITDELSQDEQLAVAAGAIIREVVPDSPAAQAGLRVGDIITAVDGEPVDADNTLRDRVLSHSPGDVVQLSIVRGGAQSSVSVTLGENALPQGYEFQLPGDGRQPFFFGDPSDCTPRGEQG